MPTQKDVLARQYLELARRREEGAFTYVRREPAAGPDGVTASERNNWNVTAADMGRIEAALAEDRPFTDKAVETEESSLEQINDAVQRMQRGDVSKYNHVPQFLREYYGRKALIEVFGSADEFPPMTEELARKLDRMTVRPEFRDAISRLIDRGAVDRNGNSVVQTLRSYDAYLNQRMLADTLKPVSGEEAGRIRQKFPGQDGEKMLADNTDRQRFLAKTLFLAQLGRVDLIEEDGSRRPYQGPTAELFSHGSRVAFTLPAGEKPGQDMVYDAWRKNALDTGVLFKGRFASHEMHRRQLDANGNPGRQFEEIRIRWKKQIKHVQFHKKLTTYFGNYGMNIPLGGMGRTFNGTDCIDDRGSFGHLYVRTRKGDPTHCGAILIGFENAQPKKESCIGQLHNFKAISHDLSSFYSTKTTFGKPIGGRETDLSHMTQEDLTMALSQFELGYQTLQERAKTDPEAARELTRLNQSLCGKRLSALELANLLTSVGMEKNDAVRCVSSGRSPKDANYVQTAGSYRKDMHSLDPAAVKDRNPDVPRAALPEAQKQPAAPLAQADRDRYQAYIDRNLRPDRNPTRESLLRGLSRVVSAHYLKKMNRKFNKDALEHFAKSVRKTCAFDTLKNEELLEALGSENAARSKSLEMRDKLYKVPESSQFTYCRTMKQLLRTMVDPEGHSEAYRKLYQSVKTASELERSLRWQNPDQRSAALMEANLRVLDCVDAYTQGKESGRKTLKGVNTFDSALDAAACVQRYVPGAALRNGVLIDRINLARKPEDRLRPDAFTKEYGRGVNRNNIKSWEELNSLKRAPADPEKNAAPSIRGV